MFRVYGYNRLASKSTINEILCVLTVTGPSPRFGYPWGVGAILFCAYSWDVEPRRWPERLWKTGKSE